MFACRKIITRISIRQSYVFKVKNYGLYVRLCPDVCFQLRDMFFIYLAV